MKIKTVVLIFAVFFSMLLSAEIQGNMIGGDPYKSWEDGGLDYFVMFNSNIGNSVTLFGEDPLNPKGDTCLDSSVFTLTDFHIPDDAVIEQAYIVWMGAVDPSKIDSPTDNTITLKFQQDDEFPIIIEQEITGADDGSGNGKLLTDAASFEFEGIKFPVDVEVGCSETAKGSTEQAELGYFTYRVDITDFFWKIAEDSAEAGKFYEKIYFGDYTFSGLDCTEHDNYRCKANMVSAWAVFFIYRSKDIRPRKVYLYNGLSFVHGDKSVAEVSGFELPKYPDVRLTTMVAGGDIEQVVLDFPPEGIFLQGEGAADLFRIYNDCNPMQDDYSEVFNSVSSVVNWDPDAEESNNIQCVSGPEDPAVNYGIDVDTFLLNSEENIELQEHLKKGNTLMELTLSVNKDSIFTNFMVVSPVHKDYRSNYDIPPEASDPEKSKWNFPYDREKHFCACPSADDGKVKDYYCEETTGFREFYYMIKIQNWGDMDAENVVVSDELDEFLEYVPGTTEYSNQYNPESDAYYDWEVIPDKEGGVFPLSGDGFKIAAKMRSCDQESWTCSDATMIIYKVKPKAGTLKTYVFENVASISDNTSEYSYETNRSYPLKLSPTTCVPDTQCPAPTKEMCGVNYDWCSCETDDDCPEGYYCDCDCYEKWVAGCINPNAEFELGKNSPSSEGGKIVIPEDNDGEPLTVGQFTLQVDNCLPEEFFNFDAVTIHVDTDNETNINFSDMELIHDVDADGVVGAGEPVISTGTLTENYVKFYIPPLDIESLALKKFPGSVMNYFIVRTMVDYVAEEVPQGTTFNFYIESEKSIEISSISSQGTATISPGEIQFATFMLEPTGDFFIVTIGPNDPPIPISNVMNDDIPVLQLRTKSVEKDNIIRKFAVNIPSDGDYVKFGEKNGIKAASLYIDSGNDGAGDIKVAEKKSFSTVTNQIVFEDFIEPVSYRKGEEKYLVVNIKFNMVDYLKGKIEIPVNGIDLSSPETEVVDLPIRSKTFIYDSDCPYPQEDSRSEGCGCSII